MNMIKKYVCLFALILLCACQSEPGSNFSTATSASSGGSGGGLTTEQIQAIEKKAAACRNKGGQWVRGLAGGTCAKKLKDAGKSCRSSKQCEGMCLANGRVCSPTEPFFGCHTLYENGKTMRMCTD